jgi:hypothetical protein
MNTLAIGRCKERPQLVGIGTDPGLVDKVSSAMEASWANRPRQNIYCEIAHFTVIHKHYTVIHIWKLYKPWNLLGIILSHIIPYSHQALPVRQVASFPREILKVERYSWMVASSSNEAPCVRFVVPNRSWQISQLQKFGSFRRKGEKNMF